MLPEEKVPLHELPVLIDGLRRQMKKAAEGLEFEKAAALRDQIRDLQEEQLRLG